MKYILFAGSVLCGANLMAAVPEVSVRQRQDSVGLYGKFEIVLDVKAEFYNPFNPDEIDISATFTSPSGKDKKINGFYDYNYGALWKVRFSPDETGRWTYAVKVTDKNGQATSERKAFSVYRSGKKGPIRIASNKRYLQYADGSSFFGVGLWYNDGYAGYKSGKITAGNLDELKSLGVNFISTFITPLETYASGVGRYDQNVCGRLDEVLELCEERDMLLSLNLWFHAFLSETVWGGGNIRWYTNPYSNVTPVREFYRSAPAWKLQENLYRYFIARWGYSRALAIWFIIDEVNGTDGWVSGDSVAAAGWAQKVHDYFKQHDPYNHLTTGTRSGGIKEFWSRGYQIFDLAAREIYEGQGFPITMSASLDSAGIHPLTHSYNNYAGQIARLWSGYEKPAIIGETGWDHTYFEPGMPGYLAMYHNALWATLASGTAMSPFWWAYSGKLNDIIVSNQMLNLRKFTDEIPFARLSGLTPFRLSLAGGGDEFGMKSDDLVFGWAVNSDSDVAGKSIPVPSIRNGRYRLRLYHTWRGEFIDDKQIDVRNGMAIVHGPWLHNTESHANYTGQDIAYILQRLPDTPGATKTPARTKGKNSNSR